MSGPLEAILDEGAVGLRFFDRVVPWRDEAGGTGPSYLDLCARYDAQRGLDTDVLRADAARCRDVATTLRAELAARTEAATGLTTVWTGAAATAAGDVLAAQSTRASLDVDHLELAASTLDRAAEGLRAIVQDKAVAAADHDRRDVAGRDLDDAHATVVGATQDPSTWSVDTVDRLTALVPELGAAVARGPVALWERPEVVDAVVTACRNWVDGVFLPSVDEATTSFDDLCLQSHAAIERIFDVVDAALGDLCTDPYPTVADSVTLPIEPLPTEPLPTTPAAAEQCVGPSGTGSPSAPAVAAPEQPGPVAPAGSAVPTVPTVPAASGAPAAPAAVSVPDASVNAVSDDRLADVVRTAMVEAVSLVLSRDEGAVEAPCESLEVGPVSEPERGSEPGATSPVDATPASDLGRVEAEWAGHRARLEVHADGSIEFRAGPVAGSEPTPAPPVAPAEPPVDRAPPVDPAPPVAPTPPVAPAPPVDPAPPVAPAPPEPTPVDAPPPVAPADCVPDTPAAAPSAPPGPSPEPPVEPASDPVAGPRPALAEAGPL